MKSKFSISDIIRIIRGSLYFRFSLAIIYLGASFMIPMLWEVIVYSLVNIVNVLYRQDFNHIYEEIRGHEPSTIDYIIGCIIILVGILIFIIFHKIDIKKKLKFNKDRLDELSVLWQGARNISNNVSKAHTEDVISALNLVNRTGHILEFSDSNTIANFNKIIGDDFKILYKKLLNNNYKLSEDHYTKDMLSNVASILFNKL